MLHDSHGCLFDIVRIVSNCNESVWKYIHELWKCLGESLIWHPHETRFGDLWIYVVHLQNPTTYQLYQVNSCYISQPRHQDSSTCSRLVGCTIIHVGRLAWSCGLMKLHCGVVAIWRETCAEDIIYYIYIYICNYMYVCICTHTWSYNNNNNDNNNDNNNNNDNDNDNNDNSDNNNNNICVYIYIYV